MSSSEDLLRKLCFSEDGLLDVPLKMEKIIKIFQTKQKFSVDNDRFDRVRRKSVACHSAKQSSQHVQPTKSFQLASKNVLKNIDYCFSVI